MLTHLSLSDFTIADKLQMDFTAGMTAITGETGAGKSLVLDALNMVLGARSDQQVIRHGSDKTSITASFDIDNLHTIKAWLEDHDLATDDHECILHRSIAKDGRSKASCNGTPITLAKMRELGSQLVDMHSQHAHHKLLQRNHHESLLDGFAHLEKSVSHVKTAFENWHDKQHRLDSLSMQLNDAENRKEYLNFQLEEFNQLDIQPNEYPELEKRHAQLANAGELQSSCHQALQLCRMNDESIERQLQHCQQLLTPLACHDERIASITQLLEAANINISEACSELRQGLDSFHASPHELNDIESRLSQFNDLARKHRCKPEELPTLQEQLALELDNLQQGDDRLIALEHEVQQARMHYHKAAIELSNLRELGARKLSKKIKGQLSLLGMNECKLSVALNHNPETPRVTGYDAVEFMVSTNPGQPLQPLKKIASGGELSRISLAIQVVIAETTAMPILVFDEVDVGIGGATAEVVGKLMKTLAQKSQIISVTHQPQVASQADQHLKAQKSQARQKTTTKLACLTQNDRIHEIARMLGGMEITDTTLNHAKEMIGI
ncbi:MAG: DNA repair protein RecN [Cellvibrionales bacterium]|nr:DNA repair protein RecN [Cellvibrionales bacterium]